MSVSFVKGQGLGNTYIVIKSSELPGHKLLPEQAEKICDVNWGIGSDGVLLHVPPWDNVSDFGVIIFNPDGSDAQKSGNGIRIFAKYLYEHGHAKTTRFSIITHGGRVFCDLEVKPNGIVDQITVDMGHATFKPSALPMTCSQPEAVGVDLDVGGTPLRVTGVSMGNPHCVTFVQSTEELADARVRHLGPLLERHSVFPERTNVQFARVISRNSIEIRIWERGAGYTLASGSSSCAVASAAVRNGLCDVGPIRMLMPGGELSVVVGADWSCRLRGPVREICAGKLAPDFVHTYITKTQ